MYISGIWGQNGLSPNFLEEDIPDVITCFKFGDDRFRGLASAEGQILPFPIDFDGRPYNTLTLLCERVIGWVFITLSVSYYTIGDYLITLSVPSTCHYQLVQPPM